MIDAAGYVHICASPNPASPNPTSARSPSRARAARPNNRGSPSDAHPLDSPGIRARDSPTRKFSLLTTLSPSSSLSLSLSSRSAATRIGHVTIGASTSISSAIVEDNVLIGARCALGSGASSRRTRRWRLVRWWSPGQLVPGGQLWGSNPARYVRDLDGNEIQEIQTIAKNVYGASQEHADQNTPWGMAYVQTDAPARHSDEKIGLKQREADRSDRIGPSPAVVPAVVASFDPREDGRVLKYERMYMYRETGNGGVPEDHRAPQTYARTSTHITTDARGFRTTAWRSPRLPPSPTTSTARDPHTRTCPPSPTPPRPR